MKKVLTVLLSTVLLLSLTACQSPTPEPVISKESSLVMVPDEQKSFKALDVRAKRMERNAEDGTATLMVIWKNSADYDVFYGVSYFIERLEGEEWVSCAVRDDMSFIDIAYYLPAGEQRTERYNLTDYYDVSSPGAYRFRTEYYIQSDDTTKLKREAISRFYIQKGNGALSLKQTDIGSLDSFSFSLTWDVLGISSYDSATGKLIKTWDATIPEDYITTYYLTEAQKEKIYNLIASLDILSYPDDYDPHNGGGLCLPPSRLVLTVKTNTTEKTITADGMIPGYETENSKGQNFLSACKEIVDILTETEEWKALPDLEHYYY